METVRIQEIVAQYAAKAGFSVYLKPHGRLVVKYRVPGGCSLKPTKTVYNKVAEISVYTDKDNIPQIYVDPFVYGNDRPKIDVLMESLRKIAENVVIIKR